MSKPSSMVLSTLVLTTSSESRHSLPRWGHCLAVLPVADQHAAQWVNQQLCTLPAGVRQCICSLFQPSDGQGGAHAPCRLHPGSHLWAAVSHCLCLGSMQSVLHVLVCGHQWQQHDQGPCDALLISCRGACSPWLKQQMEIAAHWGVYTYNKEARDLVAIGAACGVTTAFKAPVSVYALVAGSGPCSAAGWG
jgi:hypothetical protein